MRQDKITGPIADLVRNRLSAVEDLLVRCAIEEAEPGELYRTVWIEATYPRKRPFYVISSES